MADKELGIKVTGDISDIIQSLDQLNTQIDSIQGKNVDVNVDVNSDSLDSLNTELDTATTNMDEVGVAAETAGEQIDSSMATAAVGVDNVSTQTVEAKTDLTELGTEGTNAGENIATGMEGAVIAIAALTAGLEIAAEDIADINSSIEKMSTMQELTGVGLDEGEYRGIIADITNAKFPTEDAIKYVKVLKTMGVDSGKLDDSATALNKISLSTGLSSDQMLSLSKNLKLVGVDMNNVASAYDAVAYGAGKSLGGVDTYTKYMERYSYKFREMGLNADQSAVLIAAASQKFGTSRQGMAAFGTALEESGGNLDVLQEKVGLTNNELKNASDITSQYSGVVETNSQKVQENATVLQQLFAVWDDIKVRGGDLLGTITSLGAAIGSAIIAPGIVAKAFDQFIPGKDFFGRYKSAIADLGGKAKDLIKTGWGKLFGDAGTDVGTKLVDKIKSVIPKSLDDLLGKIFKGGKFSAGMLFTKEDLVGAEGSQTRTSWEEVFKGWGLSQEDLTKWNDSMNKGPLEDAKANTQALSQFVTDSISSLSGITTPITDTLTWLGDSVAQWGQTGLDMVTNFVGGLGDGLPDLQTTLDDMSGKIQEAIDWLISLPGKAWQWGWDIIDSWKRGFGESLDGAKGWIEDKLTYLSGLLEGHSPPKEGPLSEIDQWGVNIGRSFMEGIGEGISGGTGLITSTLTNLGGQFGLNNFSLPTSTAGALQTTGSTIPVTINLTLPAMNSREEAVQYGSAAGQAAGQSLAEVLRGQATNAGVSTVNMMR